MTPADAETVAALIRSAFATLQVDPPPSALRVTAADVSALLATGSGGAIIDPAHACVLWTEKDGGLYISRMSVAPTARRTGLATALLAEAEREAARRGLSRLWLSTRLMAEGNRRLFARHGFTEFARQTHPGYSEPTSVDLEKHLPAPALARTSPSPFGRGPG